MNADRDRKGADGGKQKAQPPVAKATGGFFFWMGAPQSGNKVGWKVKTVSKCQNYGLGRRGEQQGFTLGVSGPKFSLPKSDRTILPKRLPIDLPNPLTRPSSPPKSLS